MNLILAWLLFAAPPMKLEVLCKYHPRTPCQAGLQSMAFSTVGLDWSSKLAKADRATTNTVYSESLLRRIGRVGFGSRCIKRVESQAL